MNTPLRMTYREACRQAIRDALIADPRCFVLGEDVGKYGGCYAVTKGLLEEFGPERIIDAPRRAGSVSSPNPWPSSSSWIGAGGSPPVSQVLIASAE